jgi:hypothetical protein
MDNPLQKIVDTFDKIVDFSPAPLKAKEGQYLLKALDYLAIHARIHEQPALVEQPMHDHLEAYALDVISYGPEE